MTYVIRRKEPRHDGTRYFNDTGPPKRHADDAAWFYDLTPAQEVHGKLREPHLWEVLTLREAHARDVREELGTARQPMNPMARALLPALLALGARGVRRQ